MKTIDIPAVFLSVAIFILLPFIYSFSLQDMEQSPRLFALAFIVTTTSLLLLPGVISGKLGLNKNKFLLLTLLFLLVNLYAFFNSVCFGDGLTEYLKLLLVYSIFIMFLLVFTFDEKYKLLFLKTIAISAVIFLVFGIAQFMPMLLDAMQKGKAFVVNYSITSTLGNKNFFAETLLLMLPLSLTGAITHRSYWRWIFLILSAIILITIVLLQTLSTWVALVLASIVLVGLLFHFRRKIFSTPTSYKKFYLGIAGIILVIFIAGLSFIAISGTRQIESRIENVRTLFNPSAVNPDSANQNSTYERITLWKTSLKIIADHPVTGVGLGNWKIVSPSYGMGSARYMATGVIRFVHPHNDLLFYASESGIVGLIIFLSMLGILIYYCISIIRNSNSVAEILTAIIFVFGILLYFSITLFSMPSARIYPPILLVVFAAMILSDKNLKPAMPVKAGKTILITVLLISFSTGIASAYIGYKRLMSDFLVTDALLQERKKNYDSMRRYLEKVDKTLFPMDATATPIAWYHGYSYFYTGNKDKAFELFQQAEKVNPNHLMVLNDLATCYNLSGDPVTAEKYYKKALSIQPAFGDAIVNLAIIYFNSGKVEDSYLTLLRYKGQIRKESVNVFQTVLMAKARLLSSDDIKLQKFEQKLKNPQTIAMTLRDIRATTGGLATFLIVK